MNKLYLALSLFFMGTLYGTDGDMVPHRALRPSEEHPIVGPNFDIDFTSILQRLNDLECCCKELTDRVTILEEEVAICCEETPAPEA